MDDNTGTQYAVQIRSTPEDLDRARKHLTKNAGRKCAGFCFVIVCSSYLEGILFQVCARSAPLTGKFAGLV